MFDLNYIITGGASPSFMFVFTNFRAKSLESDGRLLC